MASTPKPVRKAMKKEVSESRHKFGKKAASRVMTGIKKDVKGTIKDLGIYTGYTKKGKRHHEME